MKAAERVEARQWAGGPSGGREREKEGEEGGPKNKGKQEESALRDRGWEVSST